MLSDSCEVSTSPFDLCHSPGGFYHSIVGQDKMADVVKSHDMKYPTAVDPKLISEKTWAVHYYPTYAVVDRKGIVRALGLQPDHVEEVVAKLLAE